MRNLKKILALALVFAMAFTFVASAADFTDAASIGASYVDDVNMLVELGVIGGYPDGSFGPQKNITRAEFAKMAYTLKYGSDTNGDLFAAQKSTFTDVEGNANVAWAKGYINYCANQKIVSGVGNNKFNPQGNITVAEATKMILVILGCDPAKEGFTGANWASNVVAKAIDLGIFDGWSGDPTALATRELVAKLMKNAVFSPVYTYSAITGTGSQVNALGTAYNETLGEKTMGLKTETGLVVANERYYITLDAEGDALMDVNVVSATGIDSEETQIYYTYKEEDGDEHGALLEIPVALPDDMLGFEVTVFFKADQDGYRYKNVELIGDVMVTSNTVAYDVAALDVDIFPNGKPETSKTAITPYISFTVDGVEKKIMADSTIGKFAKNIDFQDDAAVDAADAFASLAWVSDETIAGAAATLTNGAAITDEFFTAMGTPALTDYRFVSVDGGKTYSYIFKMVADDGVTNANIGAVTNYSEAKGVITVAGKRFDLEEVEIIGEVAVDDLVAYYREAGKVVVEKLDEVTGAVEAINDDGSVVIGGETYALWINADNDVVDPGDTLGDYFQKNVAAMEDGTKYYAFGNVIVDFEAAEVEATTEEYAVILKSSYDEDLDAAYVTLAFADNTQSTYEVGKLNIEDRKEVYSDKNDRAMDFADNAYFGMVVKYKLMDNGMVDLSANDLGYISGSQATLGTKDYSRYDTTFYASTRYHNTVSTATVDEGKVTITGTAAGTYTALNNSSVVFVLYGNPAYQADGSIDRTDANYAPIKAAAYKLANKAAQDLAAIPNMLQADNAGQPAYAFSYALNTTKGYNKGIVAMAMTIGDGTSVGQKDTGDASESEAIAYVVSATQKFDAAAAEYYLQMTLITEDGLFTTRTINTPVDFSNDPYTLPEKIGTVDPSDEFAADTFIEYALDAEGVITNLAHKWYDALSNTVSSAEGLYLVNAVSERNGSLYFFDTDASVNLETESPDAMKFAEDGYDVITIDGGEYAGEMIIKVPAREKTLAAGEGNAVIYVNDEGEIEKVFSFVEGR
ncbi:MAG: S-layer homology domain-containing protein [Oscillospiraceae bacterium]|nr:S-layer homology domain-containing protein [Oscillospiraceae bacterium]